MSKGSKQRPGDSQKYRDQYDQIFGKKKQPKEKDENKL